MMVLYHIQQYTTGLWSCVHAGGRHFDLMRWSYCSFNI